MFSTLNMSRRVSIQLVRSPLSRSIPLLALWVGLSWCLPTLTHAEDSMTQTTEESKYSETHQQPGTADTSLGADSQMNKETTTTETKTQWKTAQSCTDESGKMYKRGTKGFKSCVEAQRKKEQMGGMAPSSSDSMNR